MKDALFFLSNFIKNPKEVGSVIPSSRFLTNEIVRNINFKKSKNIVELGPGVGTFTKSILKKIEPDAKVFCFEVNKKFYSYLTENFADERLTIINAGAEKISSNLRKIGVEEADCIVSGLPFNNFSSCKKRRILNEVKNSLNDKGKFILFQYTNGLDKMLEMHFNKVNRKFVPLNIPPSFVYICEK